MSLTENEINIFLMLCELERCDTDDEYTKGWNAAINAIVDRFCGIVGQSVDTLQAECIDQITTWTKEEDDMLRENYPVMGIGVVHMFSGKFASDCVRRAKQLGIRRNNKTSAAVEVVLTSEELDALRDVAASFNV